MQQYFDSNCIYNASDFPVIFWTWSELFVYYIQDELLANHDNVFRQKNDASGKPSFTVEQRMTVALKISACDACADQLVNKV
jgi:hypothetical protein